MLFTRARIAPLAGGAFAHTHCAEAYEDNFGACAQHEAAVFVRAYAECIVVEAERLGTRCTDRYRGMHEEDFLLSDIEHTDGRVLVCVLSAPIIFGFPRNNDVGA